MEDTSGFYKFQDNQLIYGPNGVINSEYDLLKESHLNYNYPIDGWYWFYSEQEAKTFFNIKD